MNLVNHPRQLLSEAIRTSIKELFDVSWTPRVIRQHKNKSYGKLTFVDYAVPCFEIARSLGISPEDLTKKICNNLVIKHPCITSRFTVDSVDGYINFELCDQFIYSALKDSAQWYKKPQTLSSEAGFNFLVLGDETFGDATNIQRKACFLIQDIYRKLGAETRIKCIFSNYSKEAIEQIANFFIKNNKDKKKKLTVRSTVKRSLRHNVSSDFINEYKTRYSLQVRQKLQNIEYGNFIYESDLAEETHTFISQFVTSHPKQFIKDETSFAVFLACDDEYVSLRTSSGILYRAAFILFLLNSILKETNSHSESPVVIAPQYMHNFINEAAKLFSSSGVVCFDPKVSSADIRDLSSIKSLSNHFSQIITVISELSEVKIHNRETRQNLLILVDLPIELNEYVADKRLPALFDLLNNSKDKLELLRT
ncbi:MAG: hypothetical protein U5L95_05310 [Candidatus Saccharibacteria bacterium]|nr:hypothetical protein [Candidatus Saccharibacteria bacterium]